MRFNAHSHVLPYITWGLIWDPKTKGDLKAKLDSKTNEIKESLESLLQDIDLSQVYLFVIAYFIYTPTGKREDLWDALVKRPIVFKCLSPYICVLA